MNSGFPFLGRPRSGDWFPRGGLTASSLFSKLVYTYLQLFGIVGGQSGNRFDRKSQFIQNLKCRRTGATPYGSRRDRRPTNLLD